MLIPEVDLQVMHLLAEALEAERTRLDDACVNWPDRHFVHFLTLHTVEGVVVHRRLIGALIANRLEPGMARNGQPGLLMQLPFEAMQGWKLAGQLVIADVRGCHTTQDLNGMCGSEQGRREGDVIGFAPAVEGEQTRVRQELRT